jgi:hypothetical protein
MASVSDKQSAPRLQIALRILALVLLFSGSAVYESIHLSALNAPEVWVHLRTGTWMLESRAIPRTALFSQYPNLPWNDSSWGFDFLLGVAYRIFGLRAIPLLSMVLKVALGVVTFLLARSGRAGFWQAVGLSALGQYVLSGLQPLPYVFSIVFFAIELQLLFRSRHAGSLHGLYWLPALFLVWANLHIQFVVGLVLLAVFVIALVIEHWLRTIGVPWLNPRILPLSLKQVSAISGLSLLATFITPYGFRVLADFLKASYSQAAFEHFSEMSAMSFRRPQDYLLMLLVMMAFLVLGRRRSLELFELFVLLAATGVAFRIQRDGWLVVLSAIAVLSTASFVNSPEKQSSGMRPASKWGVVAAATAIVLVIAAFRVPDRNALMNRVSENFPVKACNYIRENKLPAPLFHEYSFGSFLTWYMPEYPVVVDSRVELYGDKLLTEYFDVIGGKERLDSHPMVDRAGTLLLERNSAMAKALRNLPALSSQYRLVYSDERANVFVPQNH